MWHNTDVTQHLHDSILMLHNILIGRHNTDATQGHNVMWCDAMWCALRWCYLMRRGGMCLNIARACLGIVAGRGTRVRTRVWRKQPGLVPWYIPKYDQRKQVWYHGTNPSMTETTRFCTQVPTRVWPKQPGLVPGYMSEYDQNSQVWYPGTYPSMTTTTRFDTRVPTRVWPKQQGFVPGCIHEYDEKNQVSY